MTQRSPIVIVNGRLSELQPGDSIAGSVLGNVAAGSGLVGGGDLNTGSKRLDVALADAPSGIVFANNSLSSDGASLVASSTALASGIAAQADAQVALSGSNQAIQTSFVALASGNAALADAVQSVAYSNSLNLPTDSDVVAGDLVCFNSSGKVQKISAVSQSVSLQAGTAGAFNSASPQMMKYDPESNQGICIYYRSPVWRATSFTLNEGLPVFGTETPQYPPVISGTNNAIQLEYNPREELFIALGADSTRTNFPSARCLAVVSGSTEVELGYHNDVGTPAMSPTLSNIDTMYDTRFNVIQVISAPDYAACFEITPSYGDSTAASRKLYSLYSSTWPNAWQADTASILACGFHKHAGSGIVLSRNTTRTNYTDVGVTTVIPNYDSTTTTHNLTVLSGQQVSTASAFGGLQIDMPSSTYCPSINKVLFVFEQDNLANDPGGCFFCDIVSGRSLQSGSWVQVDPLVTFSSGCQYPSVSWDEYNEKAFIAYRDTLGSNYLAANVGTISGVSSSGHVLSISPKYVLKSNTVSYIDVEYAPALKRNIVSYYNNTTAQGELVIVSNLVSNTYSTKNANNQNNFIGIVQQVASSGTTVDVLFPKATSTTYSGLQTGSFYWLDAASGVLTTDSRIAPSWSGAVGWRPLGRAISSSGLFLQNNL